MVKDMKANNRSIMMPFMWIFIETVRGISDKVSRNRKAVKMHSLYARNTNAAEKVGILLHMEK